jgi:hypothetical protein
MMPRAVSYRAVTSVILSASLLAAAPSRAGDPVSAPRAADHPCSDVSATVERWTPAAGPPARFVAESFARGGSDQWTGLGYTGEGFWSAQTRTPSDACDDCQELDLVLMRFDGTRRVFPVVTSADHRPTAAGTPASLRDVALQRLWHLAATDWPAKDLAQDYALRLPPTRDAAGLADPYPGWMAEVSKKRAWLLRFALRAEPHMCWCLFHWAGWPLAAPGRP